MVKNCLNCGAPALDDKALFCDKCGSKMPDERNNRLPVCNNCGSPAVDDQALFCNKCGAPLKNTTNTGIPIVDRPQRRQDREPVINSSKKYTNIPLVADELKERSSTRDDKVKVSMTDKLLGVNKPKKIRETKCTCTACGNVWYFGKQEVFRNAGNALSNFNKSVFACSCCFPLHFLKGKEVIDFNKCPNCGSRAIRKEQITHDVE